MESVGMLLLLFCGSALTLRLRFIQFRRPFFALRTLTCRSVDGISPLEALSTSLGACIGTGNIAGVAGALAVGGPGALVWMWLTALVCSASKYAEIYYAQRYGGSPMSYMEKRLPKPFRILAPLYAALCLVACLTMGNVVQGNAVAEAVSAVAAPRDLRLALGLCLAALTALVTFGGAKRVGRAAAFLVPVMSGLYMFGTLAVIGANISRLPAALLTILRGALDPSAVTGGAVGFFTVFRVGVARGVFTHEAGMGTAAIAHGAAHANNPHAQALLGVFEVFFDTIVLCTLTGLAILVSGVPIPFGNGSINSAIVIDAFATLIGAHAAGLFITLALALFAFVSILGFSLFGTVAAEYLGGQKARLPFRLMFCVLIVLGTQIRPVLAWRATELVTLLIAAVNGLALLLLAFRRERIACPPQAPTKASAVKDRRAACPAWRSGK